MQPVARFARAVALMAMTSLAACSFAPPYQVPATATPPSFKEGGPWRVAWPALPAVRGDWWVQYGDPTLTGLEGRIETSNPTLSAALARYDQAQYYLAQARAGLGPRLGASTSFTRNRQSNNRPLRGRNQPDIYSAETISTTLDYELDIWGRVRNAVAAGRAAAQASDDDVAAIKLSLETTLATEYLRMRGYDQALRLLNSTVRDYAEADALTERRFAGGIASGIDIARSRTQLKEAEAERDDVAATRALSEHAIASLVGEPASTFTLRPALAVFHIPDTPVGLPSTLLERRPDVAAAERRVAAANAEIGVAKAAFFPAITLSATGGFQNTGGTNLLSAGNSLWSIGPGAVLTLLDGGRRRAQLAIVRADRDITIANYRGTVLQAFQDVENNLALLAHLSDEAAALNEAAIQAGRAEQLSLNRYKEGASTYLDVVTAQTTALRTQRAALDLETRRLNASVRLIAAVGGGWTGNDARARIAMTRQQGVSSNP